MLRNIKSKPSKKYFQIESKWKLKLKERIREFREKKLFYLEHSKFATYMEEDYLECFEKAMINYSKNWIRLADVNMSAERQLGSETFANTRIQHMTDCGILAEDTTRNLKLNSTLARIIGFGHDFGHFTYGHDGEVWISDDLEEHGICSVYHPTCARLKFVDESIQQTAIQLLEQRKGRKLTNREIKKYNRYFSLILDGIASHNGEGNETRMRANTTKTDEDIYNEFINSFTNPSTRKTIVSATVEGTIVRFMDAISYVGKDLRDGALHLRDGNFINDPEYTKLLRQIGVPNEVLTAKHSKKDLLVKSITEIFRKNLEDNSQGKNGADMPLASLMYQLRTLNYQKSNIPRTKKLPKVLSQKIPLLIDHYANYLLNSETTNIPQNATSFIKRVNKKSPKELNVLHEEIVKKGIEQYVRNEINAILQNDEKALVTIRRKRLQKDLERLRKSIGKDELSHAEIEQFTERILREIHLDPQKRDEQFEKYIRRIYPKIIDEKQIEQKINENLDLKLETYAECLARFKAAMYIGFSSNTYLLDMLEEEHLISKEERRLRYVPGNGEVPESLLRTIAGQQETPVGDERG